MRKVILTVLIVALVIISSLPQVGATCESLTSHATQVWQTWHGLGEKDSFFQIKYTAEIMQPLFGDMGLKTKHLKINSTTAIINIEQFVRHSTPIEIKKIMTILGSMPGERRSTQRCISTFRSTATQAEIADSCMDDTISHRWNNGSHYLSNDILIALRYDDMIRFPIQEEIIAALATGQDNIVHTLVNSYSGQKLVEVFNKINRCAGGE